MSYILDALRRADAERERDPARGIHAQPAVALTSQAKRATPRWAWGAACAAAVLVGLAGGWWGTQDSPPASAAIASHPVATGFVAPAPTPVVVPVAAVVSPPAPKPLAPPAQTVVERPVAKPPVVAKATAVPASAPAVAAVTAVAAPPAVTPAVPTPAAATSATPAPAAERVVAVGDLPADVQRELPKLTISGGVHSENASQRLLIVGGQVMTEGTEVAPGVVLEQIRARTAVMRYRGFKYSVPY